MVLNSDITFIERAVQLARMGAHKVCPNPMVGCVVVNEGKIISEGYHEAFGQPHAEVNALRKVTNADILQNSTVYVTLEPCSHFGKTPPCADLLISKNVKKVVIGSLDPNPMVNGKGAQKLKDAGIDVTILNHPACEQLNPKFNFFHSQKKTFVTLKWAETQDRFIGRLPQDTGAKKISNAVNQTWVHKLRSEHHAILVGTQTALLDNPKLNNRKWMGRSPIVIVLDENLIIPQDFQLFNAQRVIVLNSKLDKEENHIEYKKIKFPLEYNELSETFFQMGIQSVLVEGGAQVLQTFIDWNWWNEIFISIGNENWKQGVKAPNLPNGTHTKYTIGGNSVLFYQNK